MPTYEIVRMYKDGNPNRRIIKTGLTLEEAPAHCSDPETSSSTAKSSEARERTALMGPWFDGYYEE